jgi:putative molybdopterin biosynthesis protein
VYRKGDPRFEGRCLEDAIRAAITEQDCFIVNRNAGSGTRILTDGYSRKRKAGGLLVATEIA